LRRPGRCSVSRRAGQRLQGNVHPARGAVEVFRSAAARNGCVLEMAACGARIARVAAFGFREPAAGIRESIQRTAYRAADTPHRRDPGGPPLRSLPITNTGHAREDTLGKLIGM
jgi:hypothetical protein